MPGRSNLRLVIAIVAVLAAVAVGITAVWSVAGAFSRWNVRSVIAALHRSGPPVHTGHKVLSVPDLQRVVLAASAGDIKVSTAHVRDIRLNWSVTGKPQRAIVAHPVPGGEEIDFVPPEVRVMVGDTNLLTVTLPEGLAVTVDSDSGDIDADGNYKALATTSDSGDLHLSDFRGQLSAQADSGDIYVTDAVAEGPLVLRTGSGDIDFSGDPGLAANVSADSGDVVMAIRPGGLLSVDVTVDSGDVSSVFPQIHGSPDGSEFQGRIGTGTPGTLDVTASSGDVRLQPQP